MVNKSSLNIGQVPIKAGDVLGRYKVQNANRAELELNTPYKYSNNPFLVLGMRLAEARDMVRTHQFQKDILTNPINKSRVHKIDKLNQFLKVLEKLEYKMELMLFLKVQNLKTMLLIKG